MFRYEGRIHTGLCIHGIRGLLIPGQHGGKLQTINFKCNFINENWLIDNFSLKCVTLGVIDDKSSLI